jgi:hemerythrin-like domain-containing protein
MHAAVCTLRDEHAALEALLRTMTLVLAQARESGRTPDFGALRAMLFYIAEFPEKRHHRKESQHLFPLLRARTPLARNVLDHLDEDHARGEARIRELEHVLTAWEMLGASHALDFEKAVQGYTDFYCRHMRLEEETVLPLAEHALSEEDWQQLDAEIAGEPDPLTGRPADEEYRAMFERILERVPAPFGFATPQAI